MPPAMEPVPLHVRSFGVCLPERSVGNDVLEASFGLPAGWIAERTGIERRRVAAPSDSTAGLATQAVEAALAAAGLEARDLDLIIAASTIPEQPTPGTSAWVSQRLGTTCAAFDVNSACTGFVYGLVSAMTLMATSESTRHAVVVGAETFTRIVDANDLGTSIIFGDGAGALLLERNVGTGALLGWNSVSDHVLSILELPMGGSRQPANVEGLERGDQYLTMNGPEVMRRAVRLLGESIKQLLARLDMSSTRSAH